jgi:hypothetical protein
MIYLLNVMVVFTIVGVHYWARREEALAKQRYADLLNLMQSYMAEQATASRELANDLTKHGVDTGADVFSNNATRLEQIARSLPRWKP